MKDPFLRIFQNIIVVLHTNNCIKIGKKIEIFLLVLIQFNGLRSCTPQEGKFYGRRVSNVPSTYAQARDDNSIAAESNTISNAVAAEQ